MKKTILIATVAGAVLAAPAFAQFGFGLTVFDPTSWGELVSQLRQMQQQYSLLSQTYSQITNQYRQMQTNATLLPINMFARYRAVLSPWKFTSASNTYGTTGGWITSINSGAGLPGRIWRRHNSLAELLECLGLDPCGSAGPNKAELQHIGD